MPNLTIRPTTAELADEARRLAGRAAELHCQLKDAGGSDGPTDASLAWMALDRLANTLADQLEDSGT